MRPAAGCPRFPILREPGPGLECTAALGSDMYERILLGSVAEEVVRLSPVPVLTVRPGEGE